MTVCPTCKTRNHSPQYIWSLLQNPAGKQMWDHKGYHLDNTYHFHLNVGEVKHDVSSYHRDWHVLNVTSHFMPPTLHPSGMYGPQGIWFDDLFQDHDRGNPGVHHRNVNSKEITHGAHRSFFWSRLQRSSQQESSNHKVTEGMDVIECIKCLPITIKDTPITLKEEMVEVEVPMALPLVMILSQSPSGGNNGHHALSSGDAGPPDDTTSESSSSSEPVWRHRQDRQDRDV